jgi:hypothetical protein
MITAKEMQTFGSSEKDLKNYKTSIRRTSGGIETVQKMKNFLKLSEGELKTLQSARDLLSKIAGEVEKASALQKKRVDELKYKEKLAKVAIRNTFEKLSGDPTFEKFLLIAATSASDFKFIADCINETHKEGYLTQRVDYFFNEALNDIAMRAATNVADQNPAIYVEETFAKFNSIKDGLRKQHVSFQAYF